jgi:hypothetical protein
MKKREHIRTKFIIAIYITYRDRLHFKTINSCILNLINVSGYQILFVCRMNLFHRNVCFKKNSVYLQSILLNKINRKYKLWIMQLI